VEMRSDAEEGLTEVDEGRDDRDRVGHQMRQLDPVELQQPAQEVARGDGESALDVRDEDDRLAGASSFLVWVSGEYARQVWNLSSSGATLKLLLEDNSSRLRLLSSSGAPYQHLLNVAHMALLSQGLHAARVLG
jgi:hypothetical protein